MTSPGVVAKHNGDGLIALACNL